MAHAILSGLKALSAEKPHSSISDWVDILSSANYEEDAYEGIPELVDSINLQAGGPTEACRAIRKKLKYGDVPRQLRSLTLLKALVENCGQKFQTTLINDPLIERIKTMAHDSMTDERVKKKLMSVLASWHRQFKDDPRMAAVAGLWQQLGGGQKKPPPRPVVDNSKLEEQQRRAEQAAKERLERKQAEEKAREEAKARAKAEKEKARQPKPAPAAAKTKRKPFNFEEEKPKVLASISTASQASNNLINALKLVNREKESIEDNVRVQECLEEAKAVRKTIVRYIQLVTNENFIGTLIDSNERIITALQMYDYMLKPADQDSEDEHADADVQEAQTTGASTTSDPELLKLQAKQRIAIDRFTEQQQQRQNSSSTNQYGFSSDAGPQGIYADLQDLTFGDASRTNLPAPIHPDANDYVDREPHGSLSDFSDYDSSEEGQSQPRASTSTATSYGTHAYTQYQQQHQPTIDTSKNALIDLDDPFADPGEQEVGTPGIAPRKQYVY